MQSKILAGIYIHFPFCHHKCGFCDFYSGEFKYNEQYFSSIVKELELYNISELTVKYHFNTLYLGGGTPSIANLQDLEKFFKYLDDTLLLKNLDEITIEVNPESLTKEKLKFYKEIGINRVSVGIQSLNEDVLKKLGRLASLKQNLTAIEAVQEIFTNYSLDLLFGVVGQDLCEELYSFKTFDPPHLSAYHLTLYEGTPFYKNRQYWEKNDEEYSLEYRSVDDFFKAAGYDHYEISNFAKSEQFYSQHNLHYWKENPYLGLGAGASGFLNNTRYTNSRLKNYYQQLSENQKPIDFFERRNMKDIFIEFFLLRLRLNKKIILNLDEICPSFIVKKKVLEYFQFISTKELIQFFPQEEAVKPNLQTWLFTDRILKDLEAIYENR